MPKPVEGGGHTAEAEGIPMGDACCELRLLEVKVLDDLRHRELPQALHES